MTISNHPVHPTDHEALIDHNGSDLAGKQGSGLEGFRGEGGGGRGAGVVMGVARDHSASWALNGSLCPSLQHQAHAVRAVSLAVGEIPQALINRSTMNMNLALFSIYITGWSHINLYYIPSVSIYHIYQLHVMNLCSVSPTWESLSTLKQTTRILSGLESRAREHTQESGQMLLSQYPRKNIERGGQRDGIPIYKL